MTISNLRTKTLLAGTARIVDSRDWRVEWTLLFRSIAAACLSLLCAFALHAQPIPSMVPKLVRITGSLPQPSAQTGASVENLTLAIYRDPTGGSPLWQEIQNISVDAGGHYSLLLGSTLNEGLPAEIFASAEPRWLGVLVNRPGEIEQPRTLIASVPYALKASDAETLGGKPASAYLLAENPISSASASTSSNSSTNAPATSALKPRVSSGSPGYIGMFVNSTDLGNSVMQQSNGTIGVGTAPGAGASTVPSLDLRTNPFSQIGMAQTTDYLTFFASDTFGPAIYWNPGKDLRFGKGGTGLYNAFGFTEQMRIQSSTGNVGIGTLTPGSKLDVVGDINFSGVVKYQGNNLIWRNVNNIAIGRQSIPSSLTGVANVAAGDGTLSHLTSGEFNTAIGEGTLNGATTGAQNTGVGGNTLSNLGSGNDNTAVGLAALNLTNGNDNTAVGANALQALQSGDNNTAVGMNVAAAVTSGSNNTFIGAFASGANGITNATAIGANALVNTSNTLVLGGTSGTAVTVGIGTASPFPQYGLDVEVPGGGTRNGGIVVNGSGGNLYLGMTNGVHKFRVDVNGAVLADGGVFTSGADFAESVEVSGSKRLYEPGDLLIIDRTSHRRLALSQKPYSTLVAGIYSTRPGMLASPHPIDTDLSAEVPLAIVGIVPCKVTAENGPIHEGDLLVTSSLPGFAMRGTDRKRMLGAVVGKALEPLLHGTGVIQVLVTLQ